MTNQEKIISFLEKYKDDWPTFNDIWKKFSLCSESNFRKMLVQVYKKVSNPVLKKRAFRAWQLRDEDKIILFGIKEGIKASGALACHAKSYGIDLSHTVNAIIDKLKKLSENDEEIKEILKKGGFLK